MTQVWKPWTGEPTLESVVMAYCDEQRARYELLEELAELRGSAPSTEGEQLRGDLDRLSEQPALNPYVRFWIENGVEVAMLTAADFRAAMIERDRLRHDLGMANFDKLANAEKVERLKLRGDRFYEQLTFRNTLINDLQAENARLRAELEHHRFPEQRLLDWGQFLWRKLRRRPGQQRSG
jgi:hypothetical protein